MKERIRNAGFLVALAALLVNMPRFIIVFLQVDSIRLPLSIEGTMLGLTGFATGIVLTGGGAYLAHSIAQPMQTRQRAILTACWSLLLVFTVVLISPSLVSAIRASELVTVLQSDGAQWGWAMVAVLAVEVIAGGAMLAVGVQESENVQVQPQRKRNEPSAWNVLAGAVAQRIAPQSEVIQNAAQPATHSLQFATENETENASEDATDTPEVSPVRIRKLQSLSGKHVNGPDDLMGLLGVAKRTAYDYWNDGMTAGVIAKNGSGYVVQ